MHVIGTAGHVDHGKSTLVRALTGIDPDRLAEEKKRGLTIDLGFAWLRLPSGREVGIVDVPGHERFIKNMLAGVGAINVNLFVVAANEGWKPQSQEHLDILNLLGVSSAVIVLTKIDTVETERVSAVIEAVSAKLAGTSLEGSPVVAVSAATGEGITQLLRTIDDVLSATRPAEDRDRPRLWIDRVFSMKGSGTVVTGTLTGGSLKKAEEVEVLPDGERARIRSIQSHKNELAHVGPGNRVALNLSGIDSKQLTRGEILTRPKIWATTDQVIASIQFLANLEHEPTEKGAFKLYAGSVELDASIRFLEEPPKPGGEAIAAIRLDRPTVFDFKDRFIIRDSGRRETVGGGIVLEAHPRHVRGRAGELVKGAAARLTRADDRAAYLQILLEEESFLPLSQIPLRTGLGLQEAKQLEAVFLPSFIVSREAFNAITEDLIGYVKEYQAGHPLDAGMPLTAVRARMRLDNHLLDEAIAELVRTGALVADSTAVRTPGFAPQTQSPERTRLMDTLAKAGSSPPTVSELRAQFGQELLRALIRNGELVQISPELVFSSNWLEELKARLAERAKVSGSFTVAEFRDLIQTTRKYAVPLLEYLDGVGFTRREGDYRVLGPTSGVA